MATFPAIAPIHPAPKQTAATNTRTLLGDGYEVSLRFGLNNVSPEWSLTWETTESNSTAIDNFLQARADAGEFFEWAAPDSYYDTLDLVPSFDSLPQLDILFYTRQWRCDEWTVKQLTYNWRRVEATFRQVFEIAG